MVENECCVINNLYKLIFVMKFVSIVYLLLEYLGYLFYRLINNV